jgi:hypothetical protein
MMLINASSASQEPIVQQEVTNHASHAQQESLVDQENHPVWFVEQVQVLITIIIASSVRLVNSVSQESINPVNRAHIIPLILILDKLHARHAQKVI